MKKKILAIALAVALIAIMVGGSLAYFTDNDEVTNAFTVGSVKIEIYENDEKTDSDTKTFENLIPVVDMQNPSGDKNYQKKEVKVQNTGANEAYIRTHIAIPADLEGYLYLDLDETGWTRQQPDTTAEVEGVKYKVFTYDYNTAVEPDKFTGKLLKGVYLHSYVDLEEDVSGNLVFILRDADGNKVESSGFVAHKVNGGAYTPEKVNVLVASQAIQASGFGNATDALNTGFGTGTNPWKQ